MVGYGVATRGESGTVGLLDPGIDTCGPKHVKIVMSLSHHRNSD